MKIVDAANTLLSQAYNASGGDTRAIFDIHEVARRASIPMDLLDGAYEYLTRRNLLEPKALGGYVSITPRGVDLVEHVSPSLENQADRWAFLKLSFETAKGNPRAILNIWDVGDLLQWDRSRTSKVYQYLSGKGLLAARTLGGGYSITSDATDIIERAESNPTRATDYFPPLSSLNMTIKDSFNNSNVVGSIIGSPGAHLSTGNLDLVVEQSSNADPLRKAFEDLKSAIEASSLPAQEKESAVADTETAIAQLRKKEPNRGVLVAVWQSLKPILVPLSDYAVKSAADQVASHLKG